MQGQQADTEQRQRMHQLVMRPRLEHRQVVGRQLVFQAMSREGAQGDTGKAGESG